MLKLVYSTRFQSHITNMTRLASDSYKGLLFEK